MTARLCTAGAAAHACGESVSRTGYSRDATLREAGSPIVDDGVAHMIVIPSRMRETK